MIVWAVMLLSAASNPDHRADFQEMTGKSFQRFARMADRQCPAQRLRYLYPADLISTEERFEMQLSTEMRERLASLNTGFEGCPMAGASCPGQNELDAIASLDLLRPFTRFACSDTQ
jgi:hypothetical protein